MDAARLRNAVALLLQQLLLQQRLRRNLLLNVVVIVLQDRFYAQLDVSTIARVVHATQSLIAVL